MASNASNSSSSSSGSLMMETERRPQAEPLPPKVGEIGHAAAGAAQADADGMVDVPMGSHPAESRNSEHAASLSTASLNSTTNPTTTSSGSTRSTKKSILKFLRVERPIPTTFGIRVSTWIRLFVTLLTLSATVVGWAMLIMHISRHPSSPPPPSPNSEAPSSAPDNSNDPQMALSSLIFVHVAFGVATIFQLLFLERTIFLARAERYNHLHPNAMINPNGANHFPSGGLRSLAPWNRPSLPTYAAALGFRGTGDVEDVAIAQAPPPAYGNTRGSTMLLSGMLRNSLVERNRQDAIENGSRPVSYASRASRDIELVQPITVSPEAYAESGNRHDADRARRLEEALARLEEGGGSRMPAPPSAAVLHS